MEGLFWLLGADGMHIAAFLLWALTALCALLAAALIARGIIDAEGTEGIGALLMLCAGGLWFSGVQLESYLPPSAQEQTYISEEHQLASVGNLREQESTTSTYSGILTYASTTTVDNVETIRFIRQQQDERGTYYTIEARPMSEVRLYQSNDEAPMERHWHTRTVATNPYTGEEYYFNDRLDFVEIKVPEGSVANDYELSLNQ